MRILSDVSEGLNYLHSLEPPILHHSLKPSNVLIDLEYRAKISDYGLATWRRQQMLSLLQNCNDKSCWDLLYFSPEILQGGSFSREGDMYSFGMMCWEVLSRQKPLRECTALLQTILSTFRKEAISDAIYNLIHAKNPQPVGRMQNKSEQTSLKCEGHLKSHPVCKSKGSRSPPHSLSTFLMPDSSASDKSTLPFCKESEDRQKPLPKLAQDLGHSLTYNSQQNSWSENRSTGSCYKQKSCSILACERETILNCMTEGRLNHLLDVLRSQQLLSRTDYEMITSFPTLTARTRAMLDTCLSLGEKAAQIVVSVLSTSKCSPLLQSIQANAVY
ncbi:hypothetical protein JD844_000161 [Phrynosoma platyrhinos]|uniref:Receptor-interacting serine/threonine-protein kinase 2 n=1 Tax=Phrynosoma platyrhinos TaxID=52577 RepID=A0ABQ7SQ95_PHRPL|nr:hypothetical protein JD844_000161 [Phrynosoma platyrhinos]